MPHSDTPPQVTLYLRDPVATTIYDQQQAIYDQLQTLREEGRVAGLSLKVWGKQIPTDRDETIGAAKTSVDTYEEFRSWAEDAGYSLTPGFSKHTSSSVVDDDQHDVIRFPLMCLAAYDGDRLLDVAPRTTAEGIYTVEDFLTELRDGAHISGEMVALGPE